MSMYKFGEVAAAQLQPCDQCVLGMYMCVCVCNNKNGDDGPMRKITLRAT